MNHVKTSVLLGCIFIAAALAAQSSGSSKTKQPVATVNGQTIYDEELAVSAEGQLLSLRTQEYEIKKRVLDGLIEQKMLEAAAKKKGVTKEQLLVLEADSKVPEPSDDEIEGYYLGLKVGRPLADVKDQLRNSLKQAKAQQLRQDFMKRLRAESNIAVLLSAPRVEVGYDPARLRGNANAPVTIVEFSDYQCPYCKQAEATVKAVLAKYGDKVSLAYRDFPLRQIHSQAEIGAEASRCALEQGKYWEYHDQLFAAPKLDKDALIEYARNLKLDDKQFASCLNSEKYKPDVDKDLEAGRNAGVNGTPGFFINGIALSGAQGADVFAQTIDEELARKAQNKSISIQVSRK